MKLLVKALSTLALALAISGSALAQEYVKGEVVKIDTKQKKLTIKHEPLANLDMPAMTMVFVVAEDAMLEKVKAGQAIEFTADRVKGRITVTGIK
ncbi:hypothetical protein D3227_36335 [Mesorhizobium waimense]|uniref:Copper-binding protein n=1 Tax=Mesorhizobium waimense TaxID=1300307 RepID=A0A3A5JY89_9HYPH|nr:copper-binding protein [Mesorhizobium waimense]RJT27243.1 hypothetical protein D3227_36335 [Mesorhizobium waimense]